ncbi:TOG array regulator of axonemal microtubules protein 1 Crescerin-1 [Channa argus]|uniref:TOG array regulator of axonemal microtubules protein 1 Crescerin-1 n=1 Tax=Channa argus TaxID=215402 RepID=A0A6G1QQD3_CHAAH|nr:TOG array regulator of axonemal microtubules protein 1 Crescerin-1 [Channa argus]
MIHQTEKLWKSDNARRDAVLARLKRLAQQDFLPSSQLQTDPRHKPESSVPRYKLGTVLSLLSNDEEGVSNSWTTKTQRLQQSGKIQDAMTQEANKSWRSTSASVTSEDSFSSQNTHSPSEPRTSPLIENTTPHLPLAPQRQKRSRLPVLMMHPNSEAAKLKRLVRLSRDTYNLKGSCAARSVNLSSQQREKKLEGLLTVRALTQHHPDKLKEKVYVVCLAVIAEVKNLLPSVACAATDTIVYLAVYLRRAMDTHVEKAGSALLLRITQPPINFSIRKKIHTALEALVQNCSPVQVLNVLVNKGLGHLSAAVRATTAQQLHLLVDRLGAKAILSAGKNFTERFIHAVRKISLDKAPDVRPHGLAILHQLGPYSDFTKLWTKAIEDKDRYDLQKVLRNAMQQSTRSKSLEESGDKKTKSRGV